MKNQQSYDIIEFINQAFENGEITEEKKKECIDAELKFLEIGEY